MLRLEVGGGFADVPTSLQLVEQIFQREAFGSSPDRPVGSGEKVLGRLNDNEIAIYAAQNLVVEEIVALTTGLNDDEANEEKKEALREQLEVLHMWQDELDQLFHAILPTRFVDQITAEFDQIGVRNDFQVVVYRKSEEVAVVKGRRLYVA